MKQPSWNPRSCINPRQRPGLLAVAILLGTAVAECGGSTDPSAKPSTSGDPSNTNLPPSAGDPVAQALLSAHNAARAAASPAPSPALPALVWSDAAASAAQSWANGCTWEHDPKLDSRGMGQSIFATASSTGTFDTKPADVVADWVAESADYDYTTNTCAAGKVCGHYTAVVWRSTTGIGCGHHVCSTGSPWGSRFAHWDFWVCDYVPPGNWVGRKPY
jgi:pathogenesis-related protein 1